MNKQPVNKTTMVTPVKEDLPSILLLPLVGDRLCLDFINTVDRRLDSKKCKDAFHSYSDLLAFSLRTDIITSTTYTALTELAEKLPDQAELAASSARGFRNALTEILDALAGTPSHPSPREPEAASMAIYTSARRLAREHEMVGYKNGEIVLIEQAEAEGLNYPWLRMVRDADDLFRSSFISRVRICAAEGCGRAFLDASKNGTRRWCSMKLCGNRLKSERFRSRA